MEGKLIIFSAPSGSGKTTIVQHLLKTDPRLGFSISACTREMRESKEANGKDYYFLSVEEFKRRIENKEFVEWEEVYPGRFYGTLRSEVQRIWDMGKHVIFDVDVKGGLSLKEQFGAQALSVFVKVPSLEELEKRLKDRNTESQESLNIRLEKVKYESSFQNDFDVILINGDLKETLNKSEKLADDFLS
ncbi:MAG: guanylate kinase [Cytophagales bacterium]|nr:guanylate kinase [Cytophaga sp.]